VKLSIIKNVLSQVYVSRLNFAEFGQSKQRIELMCEKFKQHTQPKLIQQNVNQTNSNINKENDDDIYWTYDQFEAFMYD